MANTLINGPGEAATSPQASTPEGVPTWGYSAEGEKLFYLKDGESLPEGYHDHPDKVAAPAPKKSRKKAAEPTDIEAEPDGDGD